jgi:hypothetical protein
MNGPLVMVMRWELGADDDGSNRVGATQKFVQAFINSTQTFM